MIRMWPLIIVLDMTTSRNGVMRMMTVSALRRMHALSSMSMLGARQGDGGEVVMQSHALVLAPLYHCQS